MVHPVNLLKIVFLRFYFTPMLLVPYLQHCFTLLENEMIFHGYHPDSLQEGDKVQKRGDTVNIRVILGKRRVILPVLVQAMPPLIQRPSRIEYLTI